MKRTIATASLLVMVSGLAYAWQSASQAPAVQKSPTVQATNVANANKKVSPKRTGKAPAPAQQVPAQVMPPLPATLMNSAPVKPNVTMESGQLLIDAPNSTLSDVLSGIHRVTGASIEGASPTERVAVKLGPGSPEQVIAALLRGTPYDYVILGTLGRQDVVTRVLLSQQAPPPPSGSTPPKAQSSQAMGRPQQPAFQQPAFNQPTDEAIPERIPPDESAPPPTTETQADQPKPTTPPQVDLNTPKTPEQLFKELQQLQLQKQTK